MSEKKFQEFEGPAHMRQYIKAMERGRELDRWHLWVSRAVTLEDIPGEYAHRLAVQPSQEDAVYLNEVIAALVKHSTHGACNASMAAEKTQRFLGNCNMAGSGQSHKGLEPLGNTECAQMTNTRKWLRKWLKENDDG